MVLILADDLGWSDVGCFGADLHETPHIDRLADEGVRFTQAYSAAPVCSPTRAAIMSGKSPARLQITIWHEGAVRPPTSRGTLVAAPSEDHLPLEEVTLAEQLRSQGYATLHVGKWHLGTAAYYPEAQGFDVNIGGTHWGAPATFFWPFAGWFGSQQDEWRYVPGLPLGENQEYLTDRLTSEAIRLIDRVRDRPFFLNMWYHAVHTPIEAPADDVARFQKDLDPSRHHQNSTFAAMVYRLDENVGRLLKALNARGLAENTVVVFTSDNGGFINEHRGQPVTDNFPLRSGKGSLYEGGIRVPWIIRWPGTASPGTTCATPVCSFDLYPTLLAAAGVPAEATGTGVDGVDLTPLLRDPEARLPRSELFFHYPHYYQTTSPVSAIRSGDWKLLEYFEDGHVELYDLAIDLSESRDVAAQQPERARQLRERLDAWRRDVKARLPSPGPAATAR
jgi:arylsulfatase A-like enzyme